MKLYSLLLVLMAVGAVSSAIETSGLFQAHIPQAESTFDTTQVEEVGESVRSTGANAFTMITVIGIFFSLLWGAAVAVITIVPLLTAWGMPVVWAAMIQCCVWPVEIIGLYQLYTGYALQGAE